MRTTHRERHRADRIGWLRAAVLGANDGILSTASLIVGVASAHADRTAVLTAGIAGLVAGAMSMAAGEYVSVSSQRDTENAELDRERKELLTEPESELAELAGIYQRRGVEPALARKVAGQLMAKDALGAHARDELGITEISTARPVQAAGASAASFAVGAALPLAIAALAPGGILDWSVGIGSLVSLAVLGALAARTGGASIATGALRITFWGALAMVFTAIVGRLFGTAIG